MATTVQEPPLIETPPGPPRLGAGSAGGGWRDLVPAGGRLKEVQDHHPSPASQTGIWVAIAAITMSFAAFTSALVVRQGGSTDWRHLALPHILYLNTLILLASSMTLEIGRWRFRSFFAGEMGSKLRALHALYITLMLGILFIAGQYAAWLQLKAEGLYLATNPSSSFFYVFTAAHGLHVIGGMVGLIYVIRKLRKSVLRRGTLAAASYYWHFMDVLWIYLLFLLWMKL
jgi:cytochrome c oxidase subunit III